MDDTNATVALRFLDALEQRWFPEKASAVKGESADSDLSDFGPGDPALRGEILSYLRECLSAASSGRAPETPHPAATLEAENARLREQLELNRTAYDYLVRLAHHFSGEEVSFQSHDEVRAFCERIKRSVGVLVREFKELLSGRKQVQRDWSLYTASGLSDAGAGGTAFIRTADLHGDLGRFLFDWRTDGAGGQAETELRDAIDELKHHQLALMAGYERCVRAGCQAVLAELAPDVLSGEGPPIPGTVGAEPPPARFHWNKLIPGRNMLLWRRFRRRYAEIVSEDDRWFQVRFLPFFREGYREYMWARKKSDEDPGRA